MYNFFCCFCRVVCRNATKLLKRKDSSGTILKDGQLKPDDYLHALTLQNVRSGFFSNLYNELCNSSVSGKRLFSKNLAVEDLQL